jgi:hypothetical protein
VRNYADRHSLDGESLVRSSRLAARVDNNAIGDGFQLYLHGFVVTATGEWTVVQQGMSPNTSLARRYHWYSTNVRDFISEPHTGIIGENQGIIMNLVASQSKPAQHAMLETVRARPEMTLDAIRKLIMPRHHDVRSSDVDLRRLGAVLAVAYERDLHDFASLLLLEKLGPRTLQSLALVAEVIHGTPTRFSDPARFSFAHGGKDGHPFPVPLKTYDESIGILRRSLDRAKLGQTDKVDGFRRLDRLVRTVEAANTPSADFQATVERENAISPSLSGRSVRLTRKTPAKPGSQQLSLF